MKSSTTETNIISGPAHIHATEMAKRAVMTTIITLIGKRRHATTLLMHPPTLLMHLSILLCKEKYNVRCKNIIYNNAFVFQYVDPNQRGKRINNGRPRLPLLWSLREGELLKSINCSFKNGCFVYFQLLAVFYAYSALGHRFEYEFRWSLTFAPMTTRLRRNSYVKTKKAHL